MYNCLNVLNTPGWRCCHLWHSATCCSHQAQLIKGSLTVALVYKSQDFFREKTSGLEWESNPHTHISGVMLYQLSYQALGSKVVGRKGIQVLVLGAHFLK